jgi:hypothetical protein
VDKQLKDHKKLFDEEFDPELLPEKPENAISFQIMEEFLDD